MLELKIFLAQYFMILLLGLQSINVNTNQKVFAGITSLLLGCFGFYVTGMVAVAFSQGIGSMLFFAYILAGPCGIVSSMILYPYFRKLFIKEK